MRIKDDDNLWCGNNLLHTPSYQPDITGQTHSRFFFCTGMDDMNFMIPKSTRKYEMNDNCNGLPTRRDVQLEITL